ncbi:MAG: putative DNA binding domain-containing protein [Bacteroidales bacterium]|jgi:predicted HTH transcriptional regulator|nr:putative DNA binding domain-containing protein [Bacteroidales bacterium]
MALGNLGKIIIFAEKKINSNMNIQEIIHKPEGRRLEFKSELPSASDLAKTIVAFANDAGGEVYIGINDKPRKVVGISEEDLPKLEEKISNLIYDRCYPAILPEISFVSVEDKHLLKVVIYRGSMPPYYLKDKGKLKGTYIRVGSNNRLADETIIAELERKRRNVSFDSEIVMDASLETINIESFKSLYLEKTGEDLDFNTLKKLELIKKEQNIDYPTIALILFSDDSLRYSLFPNAKVECARFKGIGSEEFIDKKSITSHIGLQAEEAYNFVLRHINEGATINGVYTVSHWEYPIKAIREVIRNAVVHRDFSLTGKDIKVAVYDDMIEITSPGLLPPSIDYAAMESRQSDARNKVVASVFKRLGIIDQWGNGLTLIANEMKEYPNIKMQWQEVGLSFQVQFINTNYKPNDIDDVTDVTDDVTDVTDDVTDDNKLRLLTLVRLNNRITTTEIAQTLKLSTRQCKRLIAILKEEGKLCRIGNAKTGQWIIANKD